MTSLKPHIESIVFTLGEYEGNGFILAECTEDDRDLFDHHYGIFGRSEGITPEWFQDINMAVDRFMELENIE